MSVAESVSPIGGSILVLWERTMEPFVEEAENGDNGERDNVDKAREDNEETISLGEEPPSLKVLKLFKHPKL